MNSRLQATSYSDLQVLLTIQMYKMTQKIIGCLSKTKKLILQDKHVIKQELPMKHHKIRIENANKKYLHAHRINCQIFMTMTRNKQIPTMLLPSTSLSGLVTFTTWWKAKPTKKFLLKLMSMFCQKKQSSKFRQRILLMMRFLFKFKGNQKFPVFNQWYEL